MASIEHSSSPAVTRRPSFDEAEASNLLLAQPATAAFSKTEGIRLFGTPKVKRVLRIALCYPTLFQIPFRTRSGSCTASRPHSSVSCTPVLEMPFDSPFAQYLGKFSDSLYVCHGLMVHMVGMYVTAKLWAVTGTEAMAGWFFGFLMDSAVVAVAVF